MVGTPGDEPDDSVGFSGVDTGLGEPIGVRRKAVRVEVGEFVEAVVAALLLAEVALVAGRRTDHVGEGVSDAPGEADHLAVVEDHAWTAEHGGRVRRGRVQPAHHHVRIERPCHREHPELPATPLREQSEFRLAFGRERDVWNPVGVQQRRGHVLLARGDTDGVASFLELNDRVAKQVDVCRVRDVNEDTHHSR